MNYSLAVVTAEGCAIDKEFIILRDRYLGDGASSVVAVQRALDEADPFVAVAEAWPVDALPAHIRPQAESGALGYIPFGLASIRPDERRTFVVDLSRPSSISWRAIHQRLAIGDQRWAEQIQIAICRFFAARSIRVNEDLADLFRQPVSRVDALEPPRGNPQRVRARFHLSDGRSVVVEAILQDAPPPLEPPDEGRPGLRTRG